jgi:SAM-dependent methyltransferase
MVGLHQGLKQLAERGGRIGPLAVVADGSGCNHGERGEGSFMVAFTERVRAFFRSWWMVNNHTSERSRLAQSRIGQICNDPAKMVLGFGGGMEGRGPPGVINLNIEKFDFVHLVADAHRIPLRDNSIDAVHCGALFEHLRDPQEAATELFRVMKPGAIGFIGTPFMQPFHGYPSHYQNFTHAGHQRLFERAGFRVLEWGVSSGPAWTMAGIVLAFISTYFPAALKWPALALWFPIGLFLVRPLDRWLVNNDKAYVLASDTYVLIAK